MGSNLDIDNLLSFMELVGELKHLKRTGWMLHNVTDPETVTGHMYRMALLSFLVRNNEQLDKTKIMQMTLIHDLAECIVGDITPLCGIPEEVKHRQEDEAMKQICALLGDDGHAILELFREYEQRKSPEAKYVKDLDRLDLLMQAYEYEKRDKTAGQLQEFFETLSGKFEHPFISKIALAIYAKRENLCKNTINSK